ncbi:MAG TPA: hypothetical protein VMW75_18110 [Thermoanaerobaculia bacterium]|nr:hypothetical protein [Thermoanaerobaculia bacterium]
MPGYLPSTDGPSHVYNAWVMGQLAGPDRAPVLREYYYLNPQPVPNSLTHVALMELMRALPPAAAEKVVLSVYVLLMAAALWCLAGAIERERAWLALLGLPFTWNVLLGLGFYNFCFSVPLLLLALAWWWRRRERPGPGFAAGLTVLLVLCYFAHILAAVLALAGIGVLWLASWRRERWRGHLAHLAILVPGAVLPFWFTVLRHGPPVSPSYASWQLLWTELAHLRPVWQFTGEGGRTGAILAKLFGAWLLFSLVREGIARRRIARQPAAGEGLRALPRRWLREEDGFLALALLLTGLYFFSPEGAAGGSMLKPRLAMMPFLAVLPWLSASVGRWGRAAAVLALAALAARPVTYAVPCYRAGSRDVEAFIHGLDAVPPGSVVVPLIFDRHTTSCMRTGSVDHAAGYAAVAKGLIDWDNYEANTDYFPVRFRAFARRSTPLDIESDPQHLRVQQLRARVDYIYCWRMPPAAPVAGRLGRQCKLIAAGDEWRLYSADLPPDSASDSSGKPRAAYSP